MLRAALLSLLCLTLGCFFPRYSTDLDHLYGSGVETGCRALFWPADPSGKQFFYVFDDEGLSLEDATLRRLFPGSTNLNPPDRRPVESLIVILPPHPAAGLRTAADRLTAPFVRARPEVAVHVVPAVAGVTGLASVKKLCKAVDDLIHKRGGFATSDPFLGISLLLAYLEGTPDLIVVPFTEGKERYAVVPTLPLLYTTVRPKAQEGPKRLDRDQLDRYFKDPPGPSHVQVLFLLPAGMSKERAASCFAAGEMAVHDLSCLSVTFSGAIPMPGTRTKITDMKAARELARMELMEFRMASLLLQSQHRLLLSAPKGGSTAE